jgi:protein O-mannosyl-transferase
LAFRNSHFLFIGLRAFSIFHQANSMSRKSRRRQQEQPSGTTAGDPSAAGPADIACKRRRLEVIGICALLVIVVFSVFGRTIGYGFVNYDDGTNVYDAPQVIAGLSLRGIAWAFTHLQVGRWTPIAAISRMIDCQVFGLWAGGHHLTNVLLHALATVLLFLLLQELTGSTRCSGFVAVVFTLHPLHVECVAWVSARGELLCGVFFMLALWSYALYARNPERRLQYALSLFWFLLGLLSKPMIVTLPFVLLLLDYWPLRRFGKISRLLAEKAPFFLISACFCVSTFLVTPGTPAALRLPLWLRIQNALVSCCVYLRQTVWPAGLAAYYPNPEHAFPLWEVAGSLALICFLSVAAFGLRKTYPSLLVGWLWFLGMLVPVIGVVQVSNFAHADRYVYLPQIGLCIAATWAMAGWSGEQRYRRVALGSMAVVIPCVLMVPAWRQTAYWRDGETLWTHAIASTPENFFARDHLGIALLGKGQPRGALTQFQLALRLDPNNVETHNNLGDALRQLGRTDDGIAQYREAVRINPFLADVHANLGVAFFQQGRTDEAIAEYGNALRLDPASAEARYNLGNALFQQGRFDEAIAAYRASLQINPANAQADNNLSSALLKQGRTDEAIAATEKALELQPGNVLSQNNLAWILATAPQPSLRNGARAVQLAAQARQASGINNPVYLRTLAAAYAEAGQFPDAVQTAQRAIALAQAQSNAPLANALLHEIKLYEAGHPFQVFH